MELATISMAREEARRSFLDYRAAVRERHDDEDAAIMRGYRELAAGRQLLKLSETVRAGGWVEQRFSRGRGTNPISGLLPRIAVIRADARRVFSRGVERDGSLQFWPRPDLSRRNESERVRLPLVFDPPEEDEPRPWSGWPHVPFTAIVPSIPPPLRPAHALSGYHILFEAEWALHAPPAPVDPALLKHLGGDLYAVCAVWDLTELERAVLSGRGSE